MFPILLPAVLALAPVLAVANPAPPRPDDATAPVPETRYQAPRSYRPAQAPATTPDRHWLEANRTVLGYNPMMLTMPERAQAAPGKPAPPPAAAHEHAAHGHEGRH